MAHQIPQGRDVHSWYLNDSLAEKASIGKKKHDIALRHIITQDSKYPFLE